MLLRPKVLKFMMPYIYIYILYIKTCVIMCCHKKWIKANITFLSVECVLCVRQVLC
jgi:hypothetical protein